MITWMQRHKKYLIITIWVSTIAFVGAGFVGWGAYDFNIGRSSSVAKVGSHQISIQSFQTAYTNAFNYYNSLYNGELTEELAQQMGLSEAVMSSLIDEALLMNFADEMGIIALDEDVIEAITGDKNFQVNGTFNKDVYIRALQNAGLKPSTYEDTIVKNQVILNKLFSIVFNLPVNELEKEIVGSALFMQDRLSLAIVSVEDSEVSISANETRSYWEANKNNFLSDKIYYFESVFSPVSDEKLSDDAIKAHWEETKFYYRDADDKLLDYEAAKKRAEADLRLENARRDSLKTLLAFKKGEIAPQKNVTVKASSIEYDTSAFQNLSIGDVTNPPIKQERGYEILKLTKVAMPEPLTYEQARPQVALILKAAKKERMLEDRAQARLNLFSGKDIGFVGFEQQNITGLTPEQSSTLINNVFGTANKKGYVVMNGKAYLYSITDQRLPDESKIAKNSELLAHDIKQMKAVEVRTKLVNLLKSRYKIERYITRNNAS